MFKIQSVSSQNESTWVFLRTALVLLGVILLSTAFSSAAYLELASVHQALAVIGLAIMLTYMVYGIFVYFYTQHWLSVRRKNLFLYAAEHNIEFVNVLQANMNYLPPTMIELGKRDKQLSNAYAKDNWAFRDYSFAVYHQTKNGEYKAKTFYYSVLSVKLPRILPNVFFDAKATKGREYKRLFDKSELHSLEGNFDTYFDTYFPVHYKLDSLSFITPEVMQAMIAAKDYDIEIYGDKLYLYGPLKAMPNQLVNMLYAGETIYAKLMNNIVTYRDERIDFNDGRNTVSVAGIQLRRSMLGNYLKVALGALMITISAILIFSGKQVGLVYPYLGIIGLAQSIRPLKSIMNENYRRKQANVLQRNFSTKKARVPHR